MRLKSIDILKTICAFLVVCIHIPFPGLGFLTPLTRIAVPIFFIITGYFYPDSMKKDGGIRQIKRILYLAIQANLIYLLWDCVYAVISRNKDIFSNIITLNNLLKFVLLNDSPLSGHLWYLGAILYVLIVIFILEKIKLKKILYYMVPILLIGDLILGKYSIVFWGREFPYILVRNFLFVGIPYFCIGCMIKESEEVKISRKVLFYMIILFSVTSLVERFILVSINMNATRDHYISTTPLALVVFLFALKKSNSGVKKKRNIHNLGEEKYQFTDILAVIGYKYSTWLYILHPIFITCVGAITKKIGVFGVYSFIAPIVIYITTIIFLVIIDRVKVLITKTYH